MSRRHRSYVVTALILGLIGCAVLYPCLETARISSRLGHSRNRLSVISLALLNYHAAHGQFPPAVVRSPDGQPLYSWRVLLLPYLEEDQLYRRFKLDQPWNSPNN